MKIEKSPYEEVVDLYRSASNLNKKYVKEIQRLNNIIDELKIKANLFDEYLTAKLGSYEKYFKQANRDIQQFNSELREYVASLLYDNDYKSQEIQRLTNIINKIEKLADDYDLGKYDYQIPVFILKETIKELKEGK